MPVLRRSFSSRAAIHDFPSRAIETIRSSSASKPSRTIPPSRSAGGGSSTMERSSRSSVSGISSIPSRIAASTGAWNAARIPFSPGSARSDARRAARSRPLAAPREMRAPRRSMS
ncbi:MAG: hypothetical protein A4E67_00640 [Syntrophaceae bacterium PtaB.Bin038]|nr:MAG: hypothetical protein A4E67_00640 [Syntrophaceae bacterium PtaB.Bin038]